MTVKELKRIVNSLPEDNLEVKVEIQEDGMGTTYPLSIVHYERGKIYLLGGDHEKDGLWEVGTVICPREAKTNPVPRIATCGNIGGQMVRKMIEAYGVREMVEKKRCPYCHQTNPSFSRGQEEKIIESAIGKKLAIFETHYTCLECKKNFKVSKTYSLNYEFTKTAFEEDE